MSDPSPPVVDPPAAPTPGTRMQLPARVPRYWQLKDGLVVAGAVIVIAVVVAVIGSVPFGLSVALIAAVLALGAADLALIGLRYRTLWFTIGDDQIDVERGVLFRTHTVIPMTRVQHVELERGPLADRFHLAELHIHTAAGAVTIPALDRADGEHIRQRIADLARIADDL
ncbi:MAG: PH domain-containing protein [Solirubrobacteraceae bacterium]|nr:PH domain-containing protein [Patulibacter sp.]